MKTFILILILSGMMVSLGPTPEFYTAWEFVGEMAGCVCVCYFFMWVITIFVNLVLPRENTEMSEE